MSNNTSQMGGMSARSAHCPNCRTRLEASRGRSTQGLWYCPGCTCPSNSTMNPGSDSSYSDAA